MKKSDKIKLKWFAYGLLIGFLIPLAMFIILSFIIQYKMI